MATIRRTTRPNAVIKYFILGFPLDVKNTNFSRRFSSHHFILRDIIENGNSSFFSIRLAFGEQASATANKSATRMVDKSRLRRTSSTQSCDFRKDKELPPSL